MISTSNIHGGRWGLVGCIFAVAACSHSTIGSGSGTVPSSAPLFSSSSDNASVEGSLRADRQGVTHLQLEGSPERVGRGHGQLLAVEIVSLRDVLAVYLEKETGRNWQFFRDTAARRIWPRVPDPLRREIDAIAQGIADAGVSGKFGRCDRNDVVAINAFAEIAYGYLPWTLRGEPGLRAPRDDAAVKAEDGPRISSPDLGIGVMASGHQTSDNRLLAFTSHFMSYALGRFRRVVIDVAPAASWGERFVMQTLPGGVAPLGGMGFNDNGVVMLSMPLARFRNYDPLGVPTFVRVRTALQHAATIDEALTMVSQHATTGGQFLVGNNRTSEMAMLELGLVHSKTHRQQNGHFIIDGLAQDDALRRDEVNLGTAVGVADTSATAGASGASGLEARRRRLEAELKPAKLTVDRAKRILADHKLATEESKGGGQLADIKLGKPTASTVCGHGEVDGTPRPEWGDPANWPAGMTAATITDAKLATRHQLWLIPGRPCGEAFDGETMTTNNFSWLRPLLATMPAAEWVLVSPDRR